MGPTLPQSTPLISSANPILYNNSSPIIITADNSSDYTAVFTPTTNLIYQVQKGDTIYSIAKKYGVSVLAIKSSNKISDFLSIGQEIKIPPQGSGFVYTIKRGDNLSLIALKFNVSQIALMAANGVTRSSLLKAGRTLLIPSGAKISLADGYRYSNDYSAAKQIVAGRRLDDLFVAPVTGLDWGIPHAKNGVDIAAPCGTPVHAAAGGLVIDVIDYGYNGGYGHLVKVQQFDGSVTTYAHLLSALAKVGDKVNQYDVIAYVGNSGDVQGQTGCHLHFEVQGRPNPLVTVNQSASAQ